MLQLVFFNVFISIYYVFYLHIFLPADKDNFKIQNKNAKTLCYYSIISGSICYMVDDQMLPYCENKKISR